MSSTKRATAFGNAATLIFGHEGNFRRTERVNVHPRTSLVNGLDIGLPILESDLGMMTALQQYRGRFGQAKDLFPGKAFATRAFFQRTVKQGAYSWQSVPGWR